MPEYRRSYIPGGKYFFTLVTYNRRKLFNSLHVIRFLELATSKVMSYHPFTIDAYCILPDHIHYLWTLPENDYNYSMRIGLLKRYFSKMYYETHETMIDLSKSRIKRGELEIWQRRFWEHTIRDTEDLKRHLDYIHFNPVKHGLVSISRDWPYSSFLQYVMNGFYDIEWGENAESQFKGLLFGE